MVLKSFRGFNNLSSVCLQQLRISIFLGKESNLMETRLSAAAIGLYTGGTPNLNAITNILIDNWFAGTAESIALANLSDIIIGACILYILIAYLAKPLIR